MTDIDLDGLKKLREPFTPNQINVLPKPYDSKSPKGYCNVCKGKHGLPAAHLDYVGHAALTARLLDADPAWTYVPFAVDGAGLPAFDKNGGLWIRLTACGVTRPGYGDAQGKTGPNAIKEAIGDALRNAGMRFGMALELWHKGDLYEAAEQRGTAETAVPESPKLTIAEVAAKVPAAKTQDEIAELWREARDNGLIDETHGSLHGQTVRQVLTENIEALKAGKAA